MASISNNDIARAIYLSTKDKNNVDVSKTIAGTVKFLSKRRLIARAPVILNKLKNIINQENGIVEVKVSSVKNLKNEDKKYITELLKKKYEGKEFIFLEQVDERLLGGVRIEVNNEVIDITLKHKINKLQEHLTKNA